MNAYRGLFKMTFKSELQYRAQAFSGILTQIFWGIMYIFLYSAFMKDQTISGFSTLQMTSYIWLGQAFFALKYIALPKNCGKEITNGNVCYKFVKPVNLYDQWFFEYLGQKISSTLLRCGPILLLSLILGSNMGLMLPVSFEAFLLFLLGLCISCLMAVAISMIAVYLTFVTLSEKGMISIVNVITGLLCGTFIPLPLMPTPVQNVLQYLPFRAIGDLPFRIYIGNIGIQQALLHLGIALAWLVGIILLGKILISLASKKTTIQGG